MEEILYKFIDEGRREHDEMGAFIRKFKTTNELLLKERNNSLSELKFKGKNTTETIRDTNVVNKEPPVLYHDKPIEPNDFIIETKPQETKEQIVRTPTLLIPFPHSRGRSVDGSESEVSIRRIEQVNTPYAKSRGTQGTETMQNKHLYSASANEIDEKRPELKDLPSHLEYAYLKGNESCPVIISSKLTQKEKNHFCRRMPFGLCDAPATFQRCLTAIFHDMVEDFIEVFMDDLPDAKPRLMRWHLLLQGFNIEIKDKKGEENLAAYHLSRIENPNMRELTEEEIADKFLDKNLMILKANLNDNEPWYADYINYIVRKVVPPKWTPERRKRFFSQVRNYFWDKPYTFRLCPDNVTRRCITGDEILEILAHCYFGPTGGHHSALVTGRKVYETGFY
nr:reverse transcriptase domain-containing protein [Tanacetum cinerariifolium]